jgi:A/G-specific adenine glycosylase
MAPVQRARRTTALAASKRIQSQVRQESADEHVDATRFRSTSRKHVSEDEDEFEAANGQTSEAESEDALSGIATSDDESKSLPPAKRRKVTTARKPPMTSSLLLTSLSHPTSPACLPPLRAHSQSYHHPVLLASSQHRAALLQWFDSVHDTRSMPWRKPFINPRIPPWSLLIPAKLREELAQRAYEVWISEIMLQQTRVAVASKYWIAWMAKFPTIEALASAEGDDVLAAWRGLGYYGRARRVHEAAKLIVDDPEMRGLMPDSVDVLVKRIPGVGRYTAGAICAIVFGKAEPMVDGNVMRVVSRQVGLLVDIKGGKRGTEAIWDVAEGLVKAVARDGNGAEAEGEEINGREVKKDDDEMPISDRPGRWGQALMELGSTVCTPKPDCAACPITATCRAFAEGKLLAVKKGLHSDGAEKQELADVEDACDLCLPLADAEPGELVKAEKPAKAAKFKSISSYFAFPNGNVKPAKEASDVLSAKGIEVIVTHASKFPTRVTKKAVPQQQLVVCAIRRDDGRYLITRRPEKGLLAGMWELPTVIMPEINDSTAKTREAAAVEFVSKLTEDLAEKGSARHMAELGCVPWVFSHLKVAMHVHAFEIAGSSQDAGSSSKARDATQTRWATGAAIDEESMGTGMHKCWTLVKESR